MHAHIILSGPFESRFRTRRAFLMNKDILLNKTQFGVQSREFTVGKRLLSAERRLSNAGDLFPRTPSVPLTPPGQDPALQWFVVSVSHPERGAFPRLVLSTTLPTLRGGRESLGPGPHD